ncbi:hypothetical protein TVAG_139640 [Trichomonas vaginalis G3]|uniref:Uncharacterized protein n=1 Tax=Trichomonas vaginalis (strain ATCC PRA-98 / G3) TaxID=412133 RepID=A2EJ31_TRIV3|nr:hypothetical protein TVAGG3_0609790 [Trichomonas vaginalis G3]EAY07334.1 hypothetical protein TVAG_139640 [Trichomonas vaginalis G3]KAI5524507.1 hypothetical protein TVAGG3_0609790 [Trichomonas vaginalis G3]|eukprot:XP_001319557.1 hypothetical protein [Trichomonas vaginalis G3]
MQQQEKEKNQFNTQMNELVHAFDNLKQTTTNTIIAITNSELKITDEETPEKLKAKQALDTDVENLHLAVSNFFGDCDKQKQKIEAIIATNVDFSEFNSIADQLMTL